MIVGKFADDHHKQKVDKRIVGEDVGYNQGKEAKKRGTKKR